MSSRQKKGQSLVEMLAGLMILIPIGLALLDFGAMVAVQTENDRLAKACARAGADQTVANAVGFATTAFGDEKATGMVKPLSIKAVVANGANGEMITCTTYMQCNLPVPLPYFGATVEFQAMSTEPIVGQLPASAS